MGGGKKNRYTHQLKPVNQTLSRSQQATIAHSHFAFNVTQTACLPVPLGYADGYARRVLVCESLARSNRGTLREVRSGSFYLASEAMRTAFYLACALWVRNVRVTTNVAKLTIRTKLSEY